MTAMHGRDAEPSRDAWGDGPDTGPDAAEQELRVLLERITPHPTAPDGRLGQVRERIQRRRRRRIAGAALLTGVAVALSSTLLPNAVRPENVEARPADRTSASASPGTDGAPTAPSDGNSPTAADRFAKKHFQDLSGLVLHIPPGWHSLALPPQPKEAMRPEVFVSNVPVTAPPRPCDGVSWKPCQPVQDLPSDGVVITFVRWQVSSFSDEMMRNGEKPKVDDVLDVECQGAGGATSYSAHIGGAPEPDTIISANICLGADVPKKTFADTMNLIENATYSTPQRDKQPGGAK
ncbi:hypothetical protein [Streptomyces sp. NPDC047315]|uniref:hypothetical protein n=1 Tax=Streptomyces sp. NPDC047315 TaxID=3155142 RepID=UPI0033C6E565